MASENSYYVEVKYLHCSMRIRLFIMISNWTWHVKSCVKKDSSKNKDGFTQMPLLSDSTHGSVRESGNENDASLLTIGSDSESYCSS